MKFTELEMIEVERTEFPENRLAGLQTSDDEQPVDLKPISMEREVQELCRRLVVSASAAGKTISSCESFTAGLFCAEVAGIPGASKVLKGGLVTYFTKMKEQLAGVSPDVIERYGVVSKECAAAMAANTRELTQADYCVSFTGNAGPSAMEGKPAGLVYCALADAEGVDWYCWKMSLERNALRLKAVSLMCEMLLEKIEQNV